MHNSLTIHTVNHVIEITLPTSQLWTMAQTLGQAFAQKDDMEGVLHLRTIDGYRLLRDTAVLRITLHDDELDQLYDMSQTMDRKTVAIKSDFVSYELLVPLSDLVWQLIQEIERAFHLDALDVDAPAVHPSAIERYGNQTSGTLFITVLIHLTRQVEFERFLQAFCVTHEYAYVNHSEPFDEG